MKYFEDDDLSLTQRLGKRGRFARGSISLTKKTLTEKLTIFLATGAYVGCIPLAPGTWGSLWGIVLYLLLARYSPFIWVLSLAVLSLLAIEIARRAEIILDRIDDPRIVIDEIAGALITYLQIPCTGWTVLTGFLLFRFFDITKIFPIGLMQRFPGGYGIVLDDLMAGIYANLGLRLFVYVVDMKFDVLVKSPFLTGL